VVRLRRDRVESPARAELAIRFHELFAEVFAQLIAKHGFRLDWASNGPVATLFSPKAECRVRLGSGHIQSLDVELGPPGSFRADYHWVSKKSLGLRRILQFRCPETLALPDTIGDSTDLKRQLEMSAGFLERYCADLLDGDFSHWHAMFPKVS
jgi:hypothetical protein